MDAIMLAAGVGERLGKARSSSPKALLRFAGRSLLERHIDILRRAGVRRLVLVVGHRESEVHAEIDRLDAGDFVAMVPNPDYRRGTLVSLSCARAALSPPEGVLVMDADVLYHPNLIDRLISSSEPNCVLLDRVFEAGDEPVKVGIRDSRVVEFGKTIGAATFDVIGEWPGFLKLSPPAARILESTMGASIAEERLDEPMEAAVRSVILHYPGLIGWEDITGLPWVEIDFPQDVARARYEILPRIEQETAIDAASAVRR